MCRNNGRYEEWQIFKLWCPWQVMDLIDDIYIEYDEYIKVAVMLKTLGFNMLYDDFLKSRYRGILEETKAKIKRSEYGDNIYQTVFEKY